MHCKIAQTWNAYKILLVGDSKDIVDYLLKSV